MKKFIYMALSALMMIGNMSHAAAAGGAGFLEGMPRMDFSRWTIGPADIGEEIRFGNLVMLGKVEEGLAQGDQQYKDFLKEGLGARASARDVAIMRQLVHLGNPAADVADPYAAILAQATDLLGGIGGMTPQETDLWAYLYALIQFNKGWVLPQMADDHSLVAEPEVIAHAGGNIVHAGGPMDYVRPVVGKVDFDGTMAVLNAKIDAYRIVKELPAL
jgi:hypothetical protein